MKRARRQSSESNKPQKKRKIKETDEVKDIEDLQTQDWREEEIKNIRKNLLHWYDSKEEREMPWRISEEEWKKQKETVKGEELQQLLTQRAYEVWVSEVMLQQTR